MILSTGGGGCLPQCMLGCHTPFQMEEPPRWRNPPRTRQTPPGWRNPPGPGRPPPPGKQTPAYGLQAAGTHPTGMHSCLFLFYATFTPSVCGSVNFNAWFGSGTHFQGTLQASFCLNSTIKMSCVSVNAAAADGCEYGLKELLHRFFRRELLHELFA